MQCNLILMKVRDASNNLHDFSFFSAQSPKGKYKKFSGIQDISLTKIIIDFIVMFFITRFLLEWDRLEHVI